ncbi:MAG: hypothetical protein K0S33_1815 [Bacteroidetes bacterium]|jgi:uncharacterized protein YggE|nr:hypothetical protein [Bacteroidota bacterium]
MKNLFNELESLLKNKIVIGTGFIVLTLVVFSAYTSRTQHPEVPFSERSIEVTGSSEMCIKPDDIEFVIGMREYYAEEFTSKSYLEYKTKIKLDKIEQEVRSKLTALGVAKEDITTECVGGYWRYEGRNIQMSKQLKFKVQDFSLIDKIVAELAVKGVEYMNVGELSSKKILEYRKTVKTDALKAAKEKAGYLLDGIGKKTGEVIAIRELGENNRYYSSWYSNQSNMLSNSSSYVASGGGANSESDFRSIKLRYEIEATFEIKN